jgi:predicted DNA-binding antitoxin AbrB/MazE fold protein
MSKNIEAIYEGGVLKPLSPLKLNEHQKVKITVEEGESAVRATSGLFRGLDHDTIEEIALSPEFLPEEA